jgi:hypothetical protein
MKFLSPLVFIDKKLIHQVERMFEMDNHDYLVDNGDSKSSADNDYAGKSNQMCSYHQVDTSDILLFII